jgi:hypothetical protein
MADTVCLCAIPWCDKTFYIVFLSTNATRRRTLTIKNIFTYYEHINIKFNYKKHMNIVFITIYVI